MSDPLIQGNLLRGLVVADREDRSLLEGASISRLLEELASTAEARGCTALVGASGPGHRLVGALLATRPGSFHLWEPGQRERVMAVDGVALGDAAVRRAIEVAMRTGAECAFGVLVAPSEYEPVATHGVVDVVQRSAA